jgi:hypothetical protein
MNDRDIETEIKAFFRRTATPEPSAHLRMAVVDSRLDAPTPRRMLLTARKTAFSLLGLAATVIIAVGLLLVAIRGGSTGPANVGTTPVQSPSTSPSSHGPATVGGGTTVTWQTGDLSLPAAFPIEQLVPIGDRLYLIASDNGSAAGPTAKASGGIWASADGLAWIKQSDIDAIKSPGTDRQTLTAASPNGRGGAVVVGSEQTTDGVDRTAAWWTADGKTWANASVEGPAGRMLSVASRPDGLVAVGITYSGVDAVAAAWRSTDGGSSWTSVPLPGGGKEARDVTIWGDRFAAIGRSSDANQLNLWASSDGATWSLAQSPSDPSFSPDRLIPFGSTLVVLGQGVPGSAILTCGNDLTCTRASVPDLGYVASFTEVRAGAEVSGTIVVNALSGTAGTVASPGPSAAAAPGLEFLDSTDGRNWTTLKSNPPLVVVTSNLVDFKGRLVAVALTGPNVTAATVKVVVGDLR